MNNEINETNASLIGELKFEIANKDLAIQDLNKALVAKNEFILDYEDTIEKFRDLVKDLQNQIKDLKQLADSNTESSKSQHHMALEKSSEIYKTKIYESKTISAVRPKQRLLDTDTCPLHSDHRDRTAKARRQPEHVSCANARAVPAREVLQDRRRQRLDHDDSPDRQADLQDRVPLEPGTAGMSCYRSLSPRQIKEKFLSTQSDLSESDAPSVTPESTSYYYKLIYLLSTWYSILRHYKK